MLGSAAAHQGPISGANTGQIRRLACEPRAVL